MQKSEENSKCKHKYLILCEEHGKYVPARVIRGPMGPTGRKGDTGPKGDTGKIGPTGEKGGKGPPGVGLTGPKGDTGKRGYQGPPGKVTKKSLIKAGIHSAKYKPEIKSEIFDIDVEFGYYIKTMDIVQFGTRFVATKKTDEMVTADFSIPLPLKRGIPFNSIASTGQATIHSFPEDEVSIIPTVQEYGSNSVALGHIRLNGSEHHIDVKCTYSSI